GARRGSRRSSPGRRGRTIRCTRRWRRRSPTPDRPIAATRARRRACRSGGVRRGPGPDPDRRGRGSIRSSWRPRAGSRTRPRRAGPRSGEWADRPATGWPAGPPRAPAVHEERPHAAGPRVERHHEGRRRLLTHGPAFYCNGAPPTKAAKENDMLVKMRPDATTDEVAAVEKKLHGLGYKTGKLVGTEITLIGVYGDISRLPEGEIEELAGVEQLIPISKAYKRAAQKGAPDRPIYQTVAIGDVVCGGDELVVIAGPCSVESEAQIIEAARMVKEAGGQCLRGGVVKYRSSPYSGWE